MGIFADGEPLSWHETKPFLEKIKTRGIEQFIRIYNRFKYRQGDQLKWGDEIEYLIIKFDHEKKRTCVSLRATEILRQLMNAECMEKTKNEFLWRPEYAEFMIEGTPGSPYGSDLPNFNDVERNMRLRRAEASKLLNDDECLITIPCFPRIGCPDFTCPVAKSNPTSGYSQSIFFPDEAISTIFPRFKMSAQNIRQRRGSNVVINAPIYQDKRTPKPFRENFSNYGSKGIEANRNALDDHVFMDATGFGNGCCSLQATLQAANMEEARFLYDQLTPITPIMLALSAGTPISRGYLLDVDCRWDMISAADDDRTDEERGLRPLVEQKYQISQSRHGTVECYLHPSSVNYNDIRIQYNEKHMDRLTKAGVDRLLAQHIAHLFIRDPLHVMRDNAGHIMGMNREEDFQCFECLQASNWMNMRFKPPPTDQPGIGWRVEFRPMEVQVTDFENAAYVCFIVLLTRVIKSSHLSFLIPISKVAENMDRAQKRDAVLKEKFYFRRSVIPCNSHSHSRSTMNGLTSNMDSQQNDSLQNSDTNNNDYEEMSIDEIINGSASGFPGLVPTIYRYLESFDCDLESMYRIRQYLTLIQKRASGEYWTLARFMREFVQQHSAYDRDSVVKEEICYDLLKHLHHIAQGREFCPKLNGQNQSRAKTNGTSACDTISADLNGCGQTNGYQPQNGSIS